MIGFIWSCTSCPPGNVSNSWTDILDYNVIILASIHYHHREGGGGSFEVAVWPATLRSIAARSVLLVKNRTVKEMLVSRLDQKMNVPSVFFVSLFMIIATYAVLNIICFDKLVLSQRRHLQGPHAPEHESNRNTSSFTVNQCGEVQLLLYVNDTLPFKIETTRQHQQWQSLVSCYECCR